MLSYQMKYEYNDELDKDELHLPLFLIYTRKIFPYKYYQYEVCQRGRQNCNNLRYADETTLLAGNEKELSEGTLRVNEQNKRRRKTIWNEN